MSLSCSSPAKVKASKELHQKMILINLTANKLNYARRKTDQMHKISQSKLAQLQPTHKLLNFLSLLTQEAYLNTFCPEVHLPEAKNQVQRYR